MADEIKARIIHDFAEDIAGRLNEAVIVALVADGLGKQGLAARAFQSLLEIEPLMRSWL